MNTACSAVHPDSGRHCEVAGRHLDHYYRDKTDVPGKWVHWNYERRVSTPHGTKNTPCSAVHPDSGRQCEVAGRHLDHYYRDKTDVPGKWVRWTYERRNSIRNEAKSTACSAVHPDSGRRCEVAGRHLDHYYRDNTDVPGKWVRWTYERRVSTPHDPTSEEMNEMVRAIQEDHRARQGDVALGAEKGNPTSS